LSCCPSSDGYECSSYLWYLTRGHRGETGSGEADDLVWWQLSGDDASIDAGLGSSLSGYMDMGLWSQIEQGTISIIWNSSQPGYIWD